ncbi:MAG TPA: type 2 isopentenyl-diphosphate Delta-isomerase [Methanomicrobiales archaeon]|nr:type 2 isopentenyl-diphosphate Delta-isomerase [Methanomicrobiales archaeon]
MPEEKEMEKGKETSSRKQDHLRICAGGNVEAGFSGFSDVRLVHAALPECSLAELDLSTAFLGHRFASPLFIAAMTGGHRDAAPVNRNLAAAAERAGIGMGVGSQRAALEDPDLEDTFTVVREAAPRAFLCANLGVVQLRDHGIEWAERAVEMIDAQAICIHANFLQEAVMPEGDHDARGCLAALAALCREFDTPVILKETGAGISRETARRLWAAGVAAIDLGGLGGTSWARVECLRSPGTPQARIGDRFSDWGIPTVVSLAEVAGTGPVIATGGVRSGLDMARGLALGADLCGMALPFLAPAMESEEAVSGAIERFTRELGVAMFLSGAGTVKAMRSVRTYITGTTRQMIRKRQEIPDGS